MPSSRSSARRRRPAACRCTRSSRRRRKSVPQPRLISSASAWTTRRPRPASARTSTRARSRTTIADQTLARPCSTSRAPGRWPDCCSLATPTRGAGAPSAATRRSTARARATTWRSWAFSSRAARAGVAPFPTETARRPTSSRPANPRRKSAPSCRSAATSSARAPKRSWYRGRPETGSPRPSASTRPASSRPSRSALRN
mmetsp:Transcript_35403/g.109649  ORF Transcript_35403/g.109649 Transcript_35403/m.109649 type:complete len:200 (+) Transcript_35403:590-1189(+)